jgi:DNA adenine methylase
MLAEDYHSKPFLKWAGGKTNLLPKLLSLVPEKYGTYIEPFVGGGALYFAVSRRNSIIADSNPELINAYQVVRDKVEALIIDLTKHKNTKTYFYTIRKQNLSNLTDVERASRLIYMNRTCFNGLYRVNRSGQFNVPFGNYKNPGIYNPEVLRAASHRLRDTKIICSDFRSFLKEIPQKDDFVYLDPPYVPIGVYSDFKRYTKDFFTMKEQEELAALVRWLMEKRVKVMLSNSFNEKVKSLYCGFKQEVVLAPRYINKNGSGRGLIKELIVLNF